MSDGRIRRDTREHKGKGWHFPDEVVGKLEQGDYALDDSPLLIAIERKGAVGEIAGNLTEKRFEACLQRLNDTVEHPFVVLEHDLSDVAGWPRTAGLPLHTRGKIRTTSSYLMKRIAELMIKYPKVRWIWAGPTEGRRLAAALFKAVQEALPPPVAGGTPSPEGVNP